MVRVRLQGEQRASRRHGPKLLALLAAVAILAALANWSTTSASMPFDPSFALSLSNANPGADTDIIITHSLPAGHHVVDSVNVTVPTAFDVADASIPDFDIVGEVRMEVDLDCDGTVNTIAPAPLVNFPVDPQLKAEWRTTLGGSWQILFVLQDLSGNQGTEIAVTPVNASMPDLYCTPQTFSYTIFATSSPGGATVSTNPSQTGTYSLDSAYLSFSFTGIQNEHTTARSDSVVIDIDTDSDGLADVVDPDDDNDSLGIGNPLWFRDSVELFVGTDPLNSCADDTIPDNEADDKWLPDLNDDQAANILDRARMVSQLLSQVYDRRFDLNADGLLNIQDRLIELLYVLEFQKTGVCPSL